MWYGSGRVKLPDLPLLGPSFWRPAIPVLPCQFMLVSAIVSINNFLLAARGSLRHFEKYGDATEI